MITRYPYLAKVMSKCMQKQYQDKWKKFIKRFLRNLDYFANVSDKLIDELVYNFEVFSLNKGSFLYQSSEYCQNLYAIAQGEIDIIINNSGVPSMIDTLYTGCSLGGYSFVANDCYVSSARAKTDCNLLRLPYKKLAEIRKSNEELDDVMNQFESFTESKGSPICDYKLYRYRYHDMKPKEKLMCGIKRLCRIIKSYKTYAIQDLLMRVKEDIKLKNSVREQRRKTRILKQIPVDSEQRNE